MGPQLSSLSLGLRSAETRPESITRSSDKLICPSPSTSKTSKASWTMFSGSASIELESTAARNSVYLERPANWIDRHRSRLGAFGQKCL